MSRKFTLEQREYNRKKSQEYYQAHREECCAKQRAYRLENRDKLRAQYHANKEQKTEQRRQWRIKNLDKERAYRRFLEFGLTREQQDQLRKDQNNKCAICETTLSEERYKTHLDHNHITGKIRGFLCNHCNRGLGGFRDDTELLQKAIEYLGRVEVKG